MTNAADRSRSRGDQDEVATVTGGYRLHCPER